MVVAVAFWPGVDQIPVFLACRETLVHVQSLNKIVEEKFERWLTKEIGKVNERMTLEISKLDIKIENTRADLI